MRKPVLRFLSVFAVLAMAVALCACGGSKVDPAEGITVRNSVGAKLEGFYVSSTDEDTWGEHVNDSVIGSGSTVVLSSDVLPDGPDTTYDVAALDENDIVYEFYEVSISLGDTLEISEGAEAPVLTVTAADGSSVEISGYSYPFEG